MRIPSIFVLFFFILGTQHSLFSQSQLENLKKDTDIVWIEEQYTLISLGRYYDKEYHQLLKFESNNPKSFYTGYAQLGIHQIIWEQKGNPDFKIYKDAELTKPLSMEEANSVGNDSEIITIINPETGKEEETTINYGIEGSDIRYIRVKQYIYYNKKSKAFFVEPISASLCEEIYDDNGNFQEAKSLFWFPIQQENAFPHISSTDLMWVKRSFIDYKLGEGSIIKKEMSLEEILTSTLNNIEQINEIASIYQFEQGGMRTLAPSNVNNGIEQNGLSKNTTIDALHLIQVWSWDKQNLTLSVHNEIVSPSLFFSFESRYEQYKNPIYQLYYQYYKDLIK